MFPSSSRVKLNRVALTDVVGHQLVPRRRRVLQSPDDSPTDSSKQENRLVSQCISVKDTSSHQPGQIFLKEHMAPENLTDSHNNREKYVAGQQRKRKRYKACECHVMEPEQEGPYTRGDKDRSREGTVMTSFSGCDPPPAQPGHLLDPGPSNLDNNVNPSFTGLAGSEGCFRRAVRASGCVDCQYIPPQRLKLGQHGQKDTLTGVKPPTVTETPEEFIWIDQYRKVTLCDIVRNSDASSDHCGYVSPDVLKTKVVPCFKQDMRTAGFLFRPSCEEHSKHGSDECALAQKSDLCPRVQSEKSVSQPESLIEHQKHLKVHTDAETLSSHTTCNFLKGWAGEAAATCSASFLIGKHTNKVECKTGIWARDVEWDPLPECKVMGAEKRGDKRLKLRDGIESLSVLLTPDSESTSCNGPAKPPRDKEKTCSGMSESQACLELAIGTSDPFGSIVTDNCVFEKPCDEKGHLRKTEAATLTSELFFKRNEVDTVELESFTCQRVRVYISKRTSSCARTYMTWPFPNSSRTLAVHAGTVAEPFDLSTRDESDSLLSQNQPSSLRNHTNGLPQHACQKTTTPSISHRDEEKVVDAGSHGREEDGTKAEGFGRTDSSTSAASPSVLGFPGWDTSTTQSSLSSPVPDDLSTLFATPTSLPPSSFLLNKFNNDAHFACSSTLTSSTPKCMVGTVEPPLLCWEETIINSCSSSGIPPSSNSESFHSSESSLLLPQEKLGNDGEILAGRCPPRLEPYYNTSLFNNEILGIKSYLDNDRDERCIETESNEFLLPPMLSPFTSPQGGISFWPRSPSSSDEKEEEINKDIRKRTSISGHHDPEIVTGHSESYRNNSEQLEKVSSDCKFLTHNSKRALQSSPNSDGDVVDGYEDKNQKETDEAHGVQESEQQNEPCSSPSSADDDNDDEECESGVFHSEEDSPAAREEGSSLPEISNEDETKADADGDSQSCTLDEFTAYEQDILLVDVIKEDPELFDNVPQESLLKLGPTRVSEVPITTRTGGVSSLGQSLNPVKIQFDLKGTDIKEESPGRPWRPQCGSTTSKTEINSCPATTKPTNNMLQYCRLYFSESLSCGFKMCRFQHLPLDGDEKFCVDTVARFTKHPMCLQKAGAVYTGYYQSNPPGVYFSIPMFLSLLWALLKAGIVPDVFSVLTVSLAYKIVPSHEFMLALFNFVREKGLRVFVPELMQLTFKMVNAGLVLSSDCFDCIKNTPEFQQLVLSNSPLSLPGNSKLLGPTGEPCPDNLNLAQVTVEIELCTKQEDWRRMGEVFRSICQSSQHPNQVERISGQIAVSLLSESKDKLSLPFNGFAETLFQNEGENDLIKSFFGRIGVSLMLRYHKTHQWSKGRKVVEVLSGSKVNYSMLKSLFWNEDGASRCFLVTVATELLLLSGSVKGALNTLRENQWFLSSYSWPCELADLESRSRVLLRLAGNTSQRETLEVLCNLPGIKEPNELIDISRYRPLFNSHLQVCVDREILPVASDTVDFMFSKKLFVDSAVLHMLLHKLGKKNLWLRAREVFRRSLSVGYYQDISAPSGFMALIVPCQLGEVELALAFEMFITLNATAILKVPEMATSSLLITLKRTQCSEGEYLSAGNRLFSAACIPQPKLTVHYTAVNSSQEQVFTLDSSSARRWLRNNHLWANKVWML